MHRRGVTRIQHNAQHILLARPNQGQRWLNAGALTTNLPDPNLLALVAEVSPAHLRIGDTAKDYMVYNVAGECLHQRDAVLWREGHRQGMDGLPQPDEVAGHQPLRLHREPVSFIQTHTFLHGPRSLV